MKDGEALPNQASEIIPQLVDIESKFSHSYTKVIAGVHRTGKKCSLVLKIDIVPRDKNDMDREVLDMSYTIDEKIPTQASRSTYVHRDDDNRVHGQTVLSLANAQSERPPIAQVAGQQAIVTVPAHERDIVKVVGPVPDAPDDGEDLEPQSVPG